MRHPFGGDVSVQHPVPKAPLFSWSARNRPGTELAIVVSRRSWRGISLWKAEDRPKKEKRTKKTERLVGTVGAAIRASRVVSMVVRKRMRERSRVSRC